MRYRVTCWAEVAIDCYVDADDEDEAREKTESALSGEGYVDQTVGVVSNDDDVEVDCIDLCDDFRVDGIEVEE